MFEVKLRPAHPTPVYHRAGRQFNKLTPVTMDVVPKAVQDDPNLIVAKVAALNTAENGDGKKKSKE